MHHLPPPYLQPFPAVPYRHTEALICDAAEQQRASQAQLAAAQRRLELQAADLAGLASRLVAAEGDRTYLERLLARLLPPGELQEAPGLEAGRSRKMSDASEGGRLWLGGEVTPRGGGREWWRGAKEGEVGDGDGEGERFVGGEVELRERLGQLGRELRAARGEAEAARAAADAAGRAEEEAKSAEAERNAQVRAGLRGRGTRKTRGNRVRRPGCTKTLVLAREERVGWRTEARTTYRHVPLSAVLPCELIGGLGNTTRQLRSKRYCVDGARDAEDRG